MTSWKFIICIGYFYIFCPCLVGAEHYFLKNLVFQPEKVLFEKNRNTEQIFLTSTPYFSCASSVQAYRFKIFYNILAQYTSRLFSFNRNSKTPIVINPSSSISVFISSLTIINFLKESFSLFRDFFSCFIFSSVGISKAD